MAIDTPRPTTRRALLAAAAGAVAATAASAIGRPLPVRATDGQTVTVGSALSGTIVTQITNSTNANTVIRGVNSGGGTGVAGSSSSGSGVTGTSTSSNGVFGTSTSHYGVAGVSTSYYGVYGSSTNWGGVRAVSTKLAGLSATSTEYHAIVCNSTAPGYSGIAAEGTKPGGRGVTGTATDAAGSGVGVHGGAYGDAGFGVLGRSYADMTGVMGWSAADNGLWPPSKPKTGVYGHATQDANARGVHGYSTGGRGVYGQATSGVGLYGFASTGYALRTSGRVRLDKAAGVATVATGTRSIKVTATTDLTTSTTVIATLQGNPGGTTTIQRVAVDAAANAFTIYLTANSTANVKVAWLILG